VIVLVRITAFMEMLLALIWAPAAEADVSWAKCPSAEMSCSLEYRPPILARPTRHRLRLRIGPVCAPAYIEGADTVRICAPARGR
jgi:hypothetical protein